MPRKSAAELALVAVDGKSTRLKPPVSLNAAERSIFLDVVGSCPVNHFRPYDLPLLTRYVEACALADTAAVELRKGAVIDGKASMARQVHGSSCRKKRCAPWSRSPCACACRRNRARRRVHRAGNGTLRKVCCACV